MHALIKLLLYLLLSVGLLVVGGAWLLLSERPLVAPRAPLDAADLSRAEDLLSGHPPAASAIGGAPGLTLDAAQLQLVLDYLMQQRALGQAEVGLASGRLGVVASLALPDLPLRRYINLTGSVTADRKGLHLGPVQIGRLEVPARHADRLARWLLHRLDPRTDPLALASTLGRIEITPGQLRWTALATDRQRPQGALTGSDPGALRAYHDRLVELQGQDIGTGGAMVELLRPLFALAAERSATADPVAENTALLTLLGTWASRGDLRRLVPGRAQTPASFRLKLRRRVDFARHFLTSAALAARGDAALSEAVGLFKELSDTDHGSGFSFTDIAADKAGTRFAALATGSPGQARWVQQRLAAGVQDGDLMPNAADLPEHLSGEAFASRFSHVGSPAYREMVAEIEGRIAACGLYHDMAESVR